MMVETLVLHAKGSSTLTFRLQDSIFFSRGINNLPAADLCKKSTLIVDLQKSILKNRSHPLKTDITNCNGKI